MNLQSASRWTTASLKSIADFPNDEEVEVAHAESLANGPPVSRRPSAANFPRGFEPETPEQEWSTDRVS
jgi:hypothetical protein